MDAAEAVNRVKLREGAASWREIDGETILLDLESSKYLGLNRAGTVLWPAIVTGSSRDELIGRLVSEFDLERDRAARDVDAFIATCRDRNLLEP
ncbi:MAG TPA: PqqD family protein [Acidimicrobiales bacterium]|nr:PqqD family protein [Acidimicrobiales bacterium]